MRRYNVRPRGTDLRIARLTEVGMIKSELIDKLAAKMTHLPEKQVSDSINLLLDIMSDALIEGRRIEMRTIQKQGRK